MLINPLTDDALDAFALAELIARMDEFLWISRVERYGPAVIAIPEMAVMRPTVAAFVATKTVSSLPDERQRALAQLFFGFLVQLELCEVAGGIGNRILYDATYNAESWQSPAFRLHDGVLWQYEVVASRIAMEYFMEMLHLLDTEERIKRKRSKLGRFRKWLSRPENPFVYFAHVLLSAYQFDRKHRTPEVHGASKLPRRLLLMQSPDSETKNEGHRLLNVLLNVWGPLLALLDGARPNTMNVDENMSNWFGVYLRGSAAEIEKAVSEMFAGVE